MIRTDTAPSDRTAGLRRALLAASIVAAAMGAAFALRILVIEPPEPAWACQSISPPWWCPLRLGGIEALRWGALGFVALAAGAFGLWRGCRRAALLALGCGAAGLVLYAAEPAAGGLLLGSLALLRR